MFHSLVLPFQIAILVLPFLATAAYFLLRRFKTNPTDAAVACCVCSVIAFVPLWVTVTVVLNQFRYGEFHFARGADVRLAHVFVPAQATDVVIHARDNGYHARFRLDSADVGASLHWLGVPKEFKTSPIHREDWTRSDGTRAFSDLFDRYGWATPWGVVEYESPSTPTGAAFSVFVDPNSNDVYLFRSYW